MKNNKLLFFVTAMLLSFASASAQTVKVTGKVLDDQTKESVIGASVIVQGTTNGTVASIDGDFTITAQNTDIITARMCFFRGICS